MEVNVSIGGGQKMTLTGAVLVYREADPEPPKDVANGLIGYL